ncbi:hypothetical protein KI387_031087 [Taxus chinensis]|uniref:Heat shock protein 70 n=1 Tax=Taxus chinensis TaxID=29808 RepID=A0AA38CF35_TAXCH|nr:hypothetical protein KI387_031087 [Taxus chinensis]
MDGKDKDKAIGIDLGTTYSCVGVWQHDRVEIIVNDQGNRTTPSMVAFTDQERFVGDAAKFQISTNPANTIFDAKRLIGRRFSDPLVQADIKLWPFAIVAGKNDKPMIEVSYKGEKKLFAAEEISSVVLTKMKMIAEQYLKCDVNKAVITVPAYFSDSQKRATKDAGKIAGLNVMHIINEPTAAAICYGFNAPQGQKKNVLVFDLGGGTFDVSIVTVETGKIEVKAVGGDMHLGGEDFDDKLVDYCVEQFKRKYKIDPSKNAKALRRLRAECERAKRTLSSAIQTVIDIDCLYEGHDFHIEISRARFEELNAHFFHKCMEIVKKCLDDTKLGKDQIEDIVLVGGSSRIPKLQELLGEFFDEKRLSKTVNPDEAVAYGAAVQAAALNKDEVRLVVMDVTPLSLGISVNDGVMRVVIPRNTPIPTRQESSVTTQYDNQTSASFPVHEGERSLVADNNLLGKFTLSGIPPRQCGVPKIKVCFEIGADGILSVSAVDKESGNSNGTTISNEGGRLSKEEIDRMVRDAERFRKQDEEAKQKHVVKNKLECFTCNMKSRVLDAKNNEMIEPSIAQGIIKTLEAAEEWLDANGVGGIHQLRAKMTELELKCKPLA